uniref:Uncharacterized protein n=1 Tax=viral metagenome TaxID=1070528 RepID=A0A6C0KQ93_9ZZZZ
MRGSVAESLGIIPNREINVPFKIWFDYYKNDISHIYELVEDKLYDVYPFTEKKFSDEKMFKKFALMLYKSSSKMIK